jgi:hypothetical protein
VVVPPTTSALPTHRHTRHAAAPHGHTPQRAQPQVHSGKNTRTHTVRYRLTATNSNTARVLAHVVYSHTTDAPNDANNSTRPQGHLHAALALHKVWPESAIYGTLLPTRYCTSNLSRFHRPLFLVSLSLPHCRTSPPLISPALASAACACPTEAAVGVDPPPPAGRWAAAELDLGVSPPRCCMLSDEDDPTL